MNKLRRPTLARRVMGVLLLAFVLVWACLIAYEYALLKHNMQERSALRQVSEGLVAGLSRAHNDEQASIVIQATSVWFNQARRRAGALPGELLFQLRARDGRMVYASPALAPHILAGNAQLTEHTIGTQVLWITCTIGARWSLCIAEPRLSDAAMLTALGVNLLPYLAISLPLVLLPLWLAVFQGLRPLRRLRDAIVARPADDLSSIDFDVKYAELQPLVLAFNELVRQLRHKVRRERAFVHDAAHELRTPMAVISTQAHVLARAGDDIARAQAKADLDHAITRASHLTEQLLELATLDEAPQGIATSVDVAGVLRQQLAQLVPPAMARGIDLSLEAPDVLMHNLDVAAFMSIAGNLVGNAVNYVHDGGRVVVQLEDDGAMLLLAVLDNGPGIPAHERERVFERFYRGSAHQAPGSGLGLSIVRQAALRLGGSVALGDGLDGRGCSFVLRFRAAVSCQVARV